MNFIKVGDQYINMAQVHSAEMKDRGGLITLYLYTSDHTIHITDATERQAVLAWLDRNSTQVVRS